ncbi:phage tail protein [uncultured Pseudomonas sp.]|uniref:phage tail protein n=1 Tax=uncultured Pseudomonas sp. TaxID=114707 RepID=UPI0025EA30F1|nr:phage tail protein [uncultured Pseudomonas sp.]
MTNLTEQNQYEDGIYQIEKSDPVVGGADGISNRQANQLANRTRWLKTRLDGLLDGSRSAALATRLATPRKINGVAFDGSTDITVQDATKAPLDSPTLTGKPIAPRPAPGTTSDQVQTAAGVLAQLAAFGVGAESVNGIDLNLNQATLGSTVRYEGTQGKAVAQNYPRVTATDSALVAFDVITHGSSIRTVQLATEVFGSSGSRARSFMRVRHDSTWFDWRELAMTDTLAKVATGGRFADLPNELQHWLAGKSATNGWKSVYLQNQEPTGNLALEMANAGGWIVGSIQGVQDGNGGWSQRLFYTPPGDIAKDRRVEWLSVYTDGVVKLGGATLPAGRTGQILTSEGDQAANGTKRFNGEVQTANSNGWRHVGSDYGSFWRNDGTALYLLLTAKGDAYGNWNDLRPFAVNLATGRVAMSAGLETLTVAYGDRSNNAASTAYVLNAIGDRAGAIEYFARTTAPNGYLKANGAAVSRTTYATLFAAIGTSFGAGDGSTTFNLPDLRGEFIRGWDDSRGVDSGRTFGSLQSGQNASHSHAATASNAGAHSHTTSVKADRANGEGNAVYGDENWYSDNVPLTSSVAGDHTHTISIAASGGNESRPRNIALLACIKY